MIDLIQQITSLCSRRDSQESCEGCDSGRRSVCHGNIEQLVRTFVDVTLHHHLIESAYMAECVPPAHRIAHNRAHMEIAEQLKAIRLVFAEGGNGVVAIDGIDRVFGALSAHLTEYDEPLEEYLRAAA